MADNDQAISDLVKMLVRNDDEILQLKKAIEKQFKALTEIYQIIDLNYHDDANELEKQLAKIARISEIALGMTRDRNGYYD